jgi:hypothetical protein
VDWRESDRQGLRRHTRIVLALSYEKWFLDSMGIIDRRDPLKELSDLRVALITEFCSLEVA